MCCAGLDPSGGAGVMADARAVSTQGVKCLVNLTSLTIQNNKKFLSSHPVPAEHFKATARHLLEEYPRPVVKTGMLPDVSIIRELVELAQAEMVKDLVVDPVIISSSGGRLISEEAEQSILKKLLPHTKVFTPNLMEAERLTGIRIADQDSKSSAAMKLLGLGAEYVIIKGGHLHGDPVDVLFHASGSVEFRGERFPGTVRGTGCSFASTIAACLAKSDTVEVAVRKAKDYVSSLFH